MPMYGKIVPPPLGNVNTIEGSHRTRSKNLHRPSAALEEHANLAFSVVDACPVTFIYNLPQYWDFKVPLAKMDNLQKINQGKLCTKDIRDINQFSLLVRLIYRLKTSRRCKMTSDPKAAELFLVPLFPKPKSGKEFCKGFIVKDLESHLQYLTNETAHKHFIVLSKGHGWFNHCGRWWERPTGLLQKVIRVAYSLPWRGEKGRSGYGPANANIEDLNEVAKATGDFLNDSTVYPHLYSVPYPASRELLGANKTLQSEAVERPFLLHFGGGLHGRFGLDLRKKIIADCKMAGTAKCLIHHFRTKSDVCAALKAKTTSKFCFEPGGDSPYRKSLYDSISLGCIPILLSPYQLLVSPWHLGHFRDAAMIYLDRDVYMKNEVNIFTYLEGLVSSGKYARMKEIMTARSHAVQYALQDHPGDGFERLLVGIKRASESYEKQTM